MAETIKIGSKVGYTMAMDEYRPGESRIAEVAFPHVGSGGLTLDLVVTLKPTDDPNGVKLHLGKVEVKQGERGTPGTWFLLDETWP